MLRLCMPVFLKAGDRFARRPPGATFSSERAAAIFLWRFLFRENQNDAMVLFELFRPPPIPVGSARPLELSQEDKVWKSRPVARKWQRKGLKRLNPRPEMVWARKPRTY